MPDQGRPTDEQLRCTMIACGKLRIAPNLPYCTDHSMQGRRTFEVSDCPTDEQLSNLVEDAREMQLQAGSGDAYKMWDVYAFSVGEFIHWKAECIRLREDNDRLRRHAEALNRGTDVARKWLTESDKQLAAADALRRVTRDIKCGVTAGDYQANCHCRGCAIQREGRAYDATRPKPEKSNV